MLRRADQVEAADMLAAAFLEDVDGGDERTARGQHGVQDDGQAAFDIAGQLGIIFHGLQRLLIAVQAHHADLAPGIMSSTPSMRPRPARRMGTMVTILPEMASTSTGPAQPCTVCFSVAKPLVAS